jgi:poly(A) polymerase
MKIVPDFFFEEGVAAIIRVFKKHGLANEARVVGGSVRDALLGRPCNDIDFATTQTPQEVTELFEGEGFSVEPTGIDHGTVTVIWNHHPYEITTLRQDVETDGRRAVVAFTKDWREDAERRDFTVNALYLDFDGEVHDPWGNDFGFENLLDRNLVFVGNAETRIREDALRIVRMYRFMSTLEFTADHSARAACKKLAHLINGLSGERLEKEITKLVEGPGVITAITAMIEDGVFEAMFGFKADVRVAHPCGFRCPDLRSEPAVGLGCRCC